MKIRKLTQEFALAVVAKIEEAIAERNSPYADQFDTRLVETIEAIRSPLNIESLVAKMNRLHDDAIAAGYDYPALHAQVWDAQS